MQRVLVAAALVFRGHVPAPARVRRAHPLLAQRDAVVDRADTFDRAVISVRSGVGGAGAVAFNGMRPAGGSGGAGGSVYLECDESLSTMEHLFGSRASLRAERGEDATGRATGSRGRDATMYVPPHCRVIDADTNATLGELIRPGERMLVAAGGAGGQGNGEAFRGSRGERREKTVPAGGAERRRLVLSMTLVADVGLVGFPNAGKSTLLAAVSRARPKVADYPFTTLVPNLGVCIGGDDNAKSAPDDEGRPRARRMVWLDIPGLVRGASEGRGLGLTFLRHAEQCSLLVHLIDGESDAPADDFEAINRELRLYSPSLARKYNPLGVVGARRSPMRSYRASSFVLNLPVCVTF